MIFAFLFEGYYLLKQEIMIKNTFEASLFASFLSKLSRVHFSYMNYHQLFIKMHVNYQLLPIPSWMMVIVQVGKGNDL